MTSARRGGFVAYAGDRVGGDGFAGALFNPAVRACLAADSGERRVEAFALFNVFYQGGILLSHSSGWR